MSEQNNRTHRQPDAPETSRRTGSAGLEDQGESLKKHGDALRDGSGNRHGEHERSERPNTRAELRREPATVGVLRMRSVCVFCGSSPGRSSAYVRAARQLGRILGQRGIRLVFGGGSVGMMGEVADATLAAGGEAVGVIPRALWEREIGHTGLTELHVVDSMHERKAMMSGLADAFVVLPGGIGTMEEFFEIWTWGQLGLHRKPYGLLEVDGYYAPLIAFLDHMVEQEFLRAGYREMVLVETDPGALLDRLASYRPPPGTRWLRPEET